MGEKIVIMGTGAMGGYLGGMLVRGGRDVTFIEHERHLDQLNSTGIKIQSKNSKIVINPIHATCDPGIVGLVDLIILCVRAYDVREAAENMRLMVKPNTLVLPIQNGVGHIETIESILGTGHLLGGVSLISVHRISHGIIEHISGPDTLEFGEIRGEPSNQCKKIEKILDVDGINPRLKDNILERMWWKLAAYSGAGVFCLVRGDKSTIWGTHETKDLYREAIAETVHLAHAKGIPLVDTVPDEHITILDSFPSTWKPSMQVALEHGEPLELEEIHGHISTMGKDVGVQTPINDIIYQCLKPHKNGFNPHDL